MSKHISLTPTGKALVDWFKGRKETMDESSKALSNAIKNEYASGKNPVDTSAKFLSDKNEELKKEDDYVAPNILSTKKNNSYGYVGTSFVGSNKSSGVSKDMQAYIDYVTAVTDKNNAWNAEQAEKQMAFQERMRNTQYQAAVKDLKAAGLNPVLAAGSGAQAAAPSGASASADTANSQMMAQLALSAIEGLSNSAVATAGGFSKSNGKNNSILDKVVGKVIDYGIRAMFR